MAQPITGAAEAQRLAAWRRVAALPNLAAGTTWVAATRGQHGVATGSSDLLLLLQTCHSVAESDGYSHRSDSAHAQLLLLPDGRIAAVSEQRHRLHQTFTLHYMGNSLEAAAAAGNAALLGFEASGLRPHQGVHAAFFDARMIGFAVFTELNNNRRQFPYSGGPADLRRITGVGLE